MADSDSSLPVRTQTNGDVVAQLCDPTTPSLKVTTTTISLKQALDVNVAGGTVSGTAIDQATFTYGVSSETPVGGVFQDTGATLTAGQTGAFRVTAQRGQHVNLRNATGTEIGVTGSPVVTSANNFPTTLDTNYGTVGASTVRSAAQIGNSTGAADFNAGATGAQTVRVVANQGAANATPWNENIAQIAGAVPSATNALPVQITLGTSYISPTNPVPIYEAVVGTSVNDYKAASAIAVGATDNHDYTVTVAKTLYLNQVEATASGKAKMIVSVETGVASGTFTVRYVQFNSTAETNMHVVLENPIAVAAGVRVRVAMSNRDLLAQDLYSTISGYEI